MDSKTTRRNITEDPNFNADCRHNHERDVDGSVYRLRPSECVCVYMCVVVFFRQVCGCFGNMCTCIYCVFVLFRLCIFILICY
jgi:hypothetical protein